MKIHYTFPILVLFCLLNVSLAEAQDTSTLIYPPVQQIHRNGAAFDFNGFKLENPKEWKALVGRTPVKNLLNSSQKEGLPLTLSLKKNIEAEQNPNNIAKAEGAYDLVVNKHGVAISAQDSIGIFYGLQSLRQLVKKQHIYPVEIQDFPTVQYRGVVEGFYGTPWSHLARLRQIRFYGRIKANTYIYGPKDDPYHSSHWREPYPKEQAENIRQLVKVAKAHFVNFDWAIHPGQDIQWNKTDRQKVLNKFEDMYQLGVRSFAVFFDDISGEGTDAHKQAALLNYLTEHFVDVKKDVNPLILTPTDYNKSWANPSMKDGYLAILGRELDSSIQIMWTGDHVMSDVTKSTLEWVKKRIQRPALFWWNFPVSDYERNQLFIGPSYGLENNVSAKELSGVLSNPMEHAEASKPAISGVADYAWNISSYQAERSWNHALKTMLPHSYKAYEIFGENNSNPNRGLADYIDKESKEIAPYLERLTKGINEEAVNRRDLIYTEGYFYNIKEAENQILKAADDSMLLNEIEPWLHRFTYLGQEGLYQLENYKYHLLNAKKYWTHIVKNMQQSDFWNQESFEAGDGTKITPVTGTSKLRPFVKFLWEWNSQTLFQKNVGKDAADRQKTSPGEVFSNVEKLKKGKFIVVGNQEIYFHPDNQKIKMKGEDFLTIEVANRLKMASVYINYKSKKEVPLTIQVSEEGKKWRKLKVENEKGKIVAQANRPFKFVRMINVSSDERSFQLNKFTIKKEGESEGSNPFTTHDFDLLTAFHLQPGDTLTEKNTRVGHAEYMVILTNSEDTQLQVDVRKKGEWERLPSSFKGTFIKVKLPKETSAIRLSSRQEVNIHEIFFPSKGDAIF